MDDDEPGVKSGMAAGGVPPRGDGGNPRATAAPAVPVVPAVSALPSVELPRGASVGRYLLLGLLGKGGMGEVYAAYDPELDRKVALKLLRAQTSAGIDASEGRSRLLREAQAIARLSDPNVVMVFDVGTFDDRVFLAMEFVDGTTLGYWLHAQPRSWREVVKTFTAAGKGLASAHRAGVVHRDFKPDNVMIGHDGKVRVMDFGLARTIDPPSGTGAADDPNRNLTTPSKGIGSTTPGGPLVTLGTAPPSLATSRPTAATPRARSSLPHIAALAPGTTSPSLSVLSTVAAAAAGNGTSRAADWTEHETATRDLSRVTMLPVDSPVSPLNSPLTESGAMMGTPAYMAPEQFEGKTLDARTDQFSFCVAVYEALYGERPFVGKNIQQLTANVIGGRVREAPTNARVPGWLRRVVLRGLRVDPGQRHASMETLLDELGRDPARTGRRWAAAGTVVAVIAVLGVGLVRTQRQQRMRCLGAAEKLAGVWELPSAKGLSARKQAIRAKFMASGKRYAADSFTVVTKALDSYVTDWNKMHRDSCEATNIRGEQSAEVLDLRMSCLNDRFSEVRALTNVFSDANGDVVTKSVEAVQAIRPVEPCADIAALRAVVKPPDDPKIRKAVADVRVRLAEVKALANLGRYRKAMEEVGTTNAAARDTRYEPLMAEATLQLAELQGNSGEYADAAKNFEDAVWLGESAHHDEVVAAAAAELVWAVGCLQRRYEDGERWGRHSAAVLRRLGPGHDVVAGWRANNLGTMYERQGNFENALKFALEAIALKTKALGPGHLDVAISEDNLALALFREGRVEEAIVRSDSALATSRRLLGPDHPQVAIRLVNRSEILNGAGRHVDARVLADQARMIWEREFGSDQPFVAYALMAMGLSMIDGGEPGKAVAPLEQALAIREAKDPESDLLGESRFALARALSGSSKAPERAMALAQQARSDYQQTSDTKEQLARVDRWIVARQGRLSMR